MRRLYFVDFFFYLCELFEFVFIILKSGCFLFEVFERGIDVAFPEVIESIEIDFKVINSLSGALDGTS
jgi:hypothetical protein